MATDCAAAQSANLVLRIPTSHRFNDLTGQRFGMLTVISFAGFAKQFPKWNVRCDCGTEKHVYANHLRFGDAASCGCSVKKHGMSRHELYSTWIHMLGRCFNKKCREYKHYGGRGITVCDRWRNSFKAFVEDMGPRPSAKHSVDRRDNDGNYCPENCRWATQTEQMRNTRRTRWLTFNGRTMLMSEWAAEIGIARQSLYERLRRLPVGVALTAGIHEHVFGYGRNRKATSSRKCGLPRKETLKGLSHAERRERRRQMAEAVRSGELPKDVAARFDVVEKVVINAIREFSN